jgi:molybdopterin synthase sulfur carrier subunit
MTLYPEAKTLIERCACAVGEDIIPRHFVIEHAMTLVLLSPVAGG